MAKAWMPADDDQLVRLAREYGVSTVATWEAIGERLGRTGNSCRLRFKHGVQEGRWPDMPSPSPWPQRDDELRRLYATLRSPRKVAKEMGLTLGSVQSRIAVLDVPSPNVKVTPEWTPASEDAPDRVWERAEAQTNRDVAKHQQRRFASVDFPDGPVGVAFISDQHIRLSGPVALQQMREDAELVRRTPGLHAVLGGDAVDNHIVISQAMVRGGTKPSEEWRLFDHYLRMFGDPGESKVLAVISGNHDEWTIDKAGVDVLGMLVKQQRVHYSPFEVVLRCDVRGARYVLKCRHRFSRFGSAFNPAHKVKRMWEMGDDDFDVGVVCHDHEPSVERFWKQGRPRVAIRPGSYQFTSSYAESHGFTRFAPRCPTVLLFPGERRIEVFDSLGAAAEVLTLLRTRKAA